MRIRRRLALLLGVSLFAGIRCGTRGTALAPPTQESPATAASEPPVPLREHAEDVVDYTLRASLDPALHTVHGEGTITWRNTSTTKVRELWLHLYLNAFKNQRSAFLRAPVASGRGTAPVTDWGHIDVHKLSARELGGVDLWPGADKTSPADEEDQTDIRVPLPDEI